MQMKFLRSKKNDVILIPANDNPYRHKNYKTYQYKIIPVNYTRKNKDLYPCV